MQNNQNLSAHARRRLNKRLKKEVEAKQKQLENAGAGAGTSDMKSNTSMTDESVPMNSNASSAQVEKIPAKKSKKPQVEEEEKQPAKESKPQHKIKERD